MTKEQQCVIDWVACELAMLADSEEPISAGTEFYFDDEHNDFRPRARALEKLLAKYFGVNTYTYIKGEPDYSELIGQELHQLTEEGV